MFEKMREAVRTASRRSAGNAVRSTLIFRRAKIILDEKGKPVDISPYEQNTATKIIEDFMLHCQ